MSDGLTDSMPYKESKSAAMSDLEACNRHYLRQIESLQLQLRKERAIRHNQALQLILSDLMNEKIYPEQIYPEFVKVSELIVNKRIVAERTKSG